jgi:serine/threonine protein kinase/tetratricopeptide (TPR) repeat protein
MDAASRYRLGEQVGAGEIADVYHAVATGVDGFERRVIVKRLREGLDPSLENSFFDEAHIAARLHHSNIVAILDFGQLEGRPFQALELIDGIDARALLQRGPIPVEIVLHTGAEIGRALDYAHTATDARGEPLAIVHRDVSPDNILIGWDGAMKLADFGVAYARERREATGVGIVKGKDRYMAPEQRRAEAVDGRADVFALGATLHELATGVSPLEDAEAQRRAAAGVDPPLATDLDPRIRPILERATRADRSKRWASAREMAEACAAALAAILREDSRLFVRDWLVPLRPRAEHATPEGRRDLFEFGRSEPPAEPTVDPTSPSTGVRRGALVFGRGDRVAGRYEIVSIVGRGGMGEVYEATDHELGTTVALKTIRGAMNEARLDQLRREVQLARKVTHPNVCRIFDVGFHEAPEGRVPFLTMELLRGQTLRARLDADRGIDPEEALEIGRSIGLGIDEAHRQGVIHRDLKTENIFLARESDGSTRVVVTDFGIAQSMDDSDTGRVQGTPAYMAPEQVRGEAVSARSDVYSFGVVLYEMVTGSNPFEGSTPAEVAHARLHHPPTPPRTHVPGLGSRWVNALDRTLALRPEDRYGTAAEVIEAIAGGPRRLHTIGLGLLAGLAFAVALAWPDPYRPPSAGAGIRPSIAVASIRNRGDRDARWIETALSEMVLSELTAGDQLRPIPADVVARMRSDLGVGSSDGLSRETLARIRAYSGADLVVTGSFLRTPERISIGVVLQDATTGDTIGSAEGSNGAPDLIGAAAQVGGELREALDLPVAREASLARKAIPADAELYAEGLDALRRLDAAAAKDCFERASRSEPDHPLLQLALAEAWSLLGHDADASEAARKAFEHSKDLPRRERLWTEARYRDLARERPRAVALYRALISTYPDDLSFGLRLAETEARAGTATTAIATLDRLRSLPPPLGVDPRMDLLEAKIAGWRGDFDRQRELAARAEARAGVIGANGVAAQAMYLEGWAARNLGDRAEAERSYRSAQALFAKANDQLGVAQTLNDLGVVLRDDGRFALAREAYEEALAIHRSIGRRAGTAQVLSNLGEVLRLSGDLALARTRYADALALAEEEGQTIGVVIINANLGEVARDRGDLGEARRRLAIALDRAKAMENPSLTAHVLALAGDVELLAGDLDTAEELHRTAHGLRRGLGERETEVESRLSLARVDLERGRRHEAMASLLPILTERPPSRVAVETRLAIARALREQGESGALDMLDAVTSTSVESASLRLTLDLERARIRSDTQAIEVVIREAGAIGYAALELEAKLALAESAKDRSRMASLEQDARSKGLLGIARRARDRR